MADAPLPFSVESSHFRSYPEYKDSGIEWLGEIPAQWEVAALRYRYEQSLGKMLDTKRITGDHLIPYLRNVDVQWDHINCLDLPSMDIRPHEIERYTVRPGDLLVCEGGEAGRCAIWRGELVTCGYQKALHRLRPLDRGRERPRFLSYTLAVAVTHRAFADGPGSTIAHLTGDMLRAHRFLFPPATEQHAIADFLDRETARIDVLIAKQEELIELLHEKRTALISNAVTKGLDHDVAMKGSGVEWLGEIPAHWEVRRLKECASVWLSNVDKKSVKGEAGVRLCNYVDVYYQERIDAHIEFMAATATSDQIHRFSLREGDVLITKDSETWTDIAVPAVVSEDLPGVLCGYHLALIRPRSHCTGAFLSQAIGAIGPRDQYHISANGITRFGLTADAIRTSLLPLPPLSEQHAIVDLLDCETATIDAMVGKVNEGIGCLEEYRTALISAAVTGKIDVRQEPEHMVTTGHTPTTWSRQ